MGVNGVKDMDCEKKLKSFKIPSLEFRSLRGYLIETNYTMVYMTQSPQVLCLTSSKTRSNGLKIKGPPKINTLHEQMCHCLGKGTTCRTEVKLG